MTLVTQVPVIEMDGPRLYYTFIAGARKVIEHQVELNKINVFPVNDGDTGTNLASTIRAVVDSLHPHRSYKITADRIAETTLVNARGNSEKMETLTNKKPASVVNISPIIGANTGIGAAAVALLFD